MLQLFLRCREGSTIQRGTPIIGRLGPSVQSDKHVYVKMVFLRKLVPPVINYSLLWRHLGGEGQMERALSFPLLSFTSEYVGTFRGGLQNPSRSGSSPCISIFSSSKVGLWGSVRAAPNEPPPPAVLDPSTCSLL